MKNKELSDKYCSRFVAEGLIKSALCASTLGFALSLISAIVSLSTGTKPVSYTHLTLPTNSRV